jgi:uncharacterized iron-regulated membrane protein
MSAGFRSAMAWLHTWAGLLIGWMLFAIFVTGTASYFREEISLWTRPEVPAVMRPADMVQSTRWALAALRQEGGSAPYWIIDLPRERRPVTRIGWFGPGQAFESRYLDMNTGAAVAARDTRGGDFFYRFHFDLSLPGQLGRWLACLCAVIMLVAVVSGIVTHRRIFADFFTFRPGKGARSWMDAHNVAGVLALPYHIMIAYTGVVTLLFMFMPWGMHVAYQGQYDRFFADALGVNAPGVAAGRPAPLTDLGPLLAQAAIHWQGGHADRIAIAHAGDADARVEITRDVSERMSTVRQTMVFAGASGRLLTTTNDAPGAAAQTYGVAYGLHVARFPRAWLHWLFVLSGVAGAAMVATGLVLWVQKRVTGGEGAHFGERLVIRLNVAAVAGLPLAMAAFFWANRLLPAVAGRADWEVRLFFGVWLASFIHAWLRRPLQAWTEQLAAGALAFAALPLLNGLLTERGLVHSWTFGDDLFMAFDASFAATAILLGTAVGVLVTHSKRKARAAVADAATRGG